MSATIRTVRRAAHHEIPKIKGSRFLADLIPVTSAGEAEERLAGTRAAFPDASHHCHAWRLGREGEIWRASDDGEPSGTAGRPILQHLEGARLTGVLLVVTRYFGGTKLGAGGLVRAYGDAARAVIDTARIVEVVITRRVRVRLGYEQTAVLEAFITARGLPPIDTVYDAEVEAIFDVPETEVEAFVADIRDRTAGRARIDVTPGVW